MYALDGGLGGAGTGAKWGSEGGTAGLCACNNDVINIARVSITRK